MSTARDIRAVDQLVIATLWMPRILTKMVDKYTSTRRVHAVVEAVVDNTQEIYRTSIDKGKSITVTIVSYPAYQTSVKSEIKS